MGFTEKVLIKGTFYNTLSQTALYKSILTLHWSEAIILRAKIALGNNGKKGSGKKDECQKA